MDKEIVNLKITADTRGKLKLLAALIGKNMMETLDIVLSEALAKVQNSDRPASV